MRDTLNPNGETLPAAVASALARGVVIPAHPLALTSGRKLDERRQVALTRYYCDAGAGGVAVGVHTTQFAIRDPRVGLYGPVLKLAAAAMADFERQSGKRMVKVAGICGVDGAGGERSGDGAGSGIRSRSAEPGGAAGCDG